MDKSARFQSLFISALCIIFAIAIQIQASLFRTETYEGLRIGAGDLLLPVCGLIILVLLALKKSLWPRWQHPFAWRWVLAFTAVITASLLQGYFLTGSWYHWALVNKYAGWFVLLAYIGLAGWISSNEPEKYVRIFVQAFLYAFLLISWCTAVQLILRGFCDGTTKYCEQNVHFFQLEGLMGNRNAYGLLLDAAAILVTVFSVRHKILPRFILPLFWLSYPTFLLLDGSRALWLSAPLLLVFFICLDWRKFIRVILPCLLIGSIFFVCVGAPKQKELIQRRVSIITVPYKDSAHAGTDLLEMQGAMRDSGDNIRLHMAQISLQIWKEHKILGGGLGAVMRSQPMTERAPYVIDNTLLWLLAETGLAGVAVFTIGFACILWALIRIVRQERLSLRGDLALSVLAMVIVFAAFSLAHELLYTRFLWFFLGLALALPLKTRLPE